MKNYALALLLLVCFLISLPVAASDPESAEAVSLQNFLQPPEISVNSFPEEITIIVQGEVPDIGVGETINFDVILNSIPLLEFYGDSEELIISIAVYMHKPPEIQLSGGAVFFSQIKQINLQTYITMI